MSSEHPITPPPEMVQQWADKQDFPTFEDIATQAARWGADQELEACCEWLDRNNQWARCDVDELRAARRPKPPSLAEEALDAMRSMRIEPCLINGITVNAKLISKYDTIRRALQRLQELEQQENHG